MTDHLALPLVSPASDQPVVGPRAPHPVLAPVRPPLGRSTLVTLLLATPLLMIVFVVVSLVSGIEDGGSSGTLSTFSSAWGTAVWAYLAYLLVIAVRAPLAVGLEALAPRRTLALRLATYAGLASAVLQAVSLLRWFFVVPSLAAAYNKTGVSAASRDATVVTYDAMTSLLEDAVGIHLGYVLMGFWITGLAVALRPALGRALGVAGVGLGVAEILAQLVPGSAAAGVSTGLNGGLALWLAACALPLARVYHRNRMNTDS